MANSLTEGAKSRLRSLMDLAKPKIHTGMDVGYRHLPHVEYWVGGHWSIPGVSLVKTIGNKVFHAVANALHHVPSASLGNLIG